MDTQDRAGMTTSDRRQASIRASVEAWNAHDLEALATFFDDDVVLRRADDPPLRGRIAYIAADEAFLRAFPDAHSVIESVIAQGDKVALEFRMQGEHRGEFKSIAATGKRIDVPIVEVITFRGAKIVEVRRYLDPAIYDRQLRGHET